MTTEFQKKRSRLTELQEILRVTKQEVSHIRHELYGCPQRRKRIAKGMTKHPVSDHALVRWLQRVKHLDTDKIKQHICSQGPMNKISDDAYEYGGFIYVICRNTVVTVIGRKAWETGTDD